MRLSMFGGAAILAALVVGAIWVPAQGQASPFDKASSEYDASVNRPSLLKRWRGILKLADTKDPRALEILAKRYERPEDPSEAVAYLIAHVCSTRFTESKHADAFDAWARRNTQARDAWLWYVSQRNMLVHKGNATLLVDASNAKLNPFIRAACIDALALRADDALLTLIPKILDDLPAKGAERSVLVESCAVGLLANAAKLGKDEFRPVADKLIRQLDEKKTEERTRLVLARIFRTLFKTDALAFEAAPWLDLLNNVQPKEPAKPSRYSEKKPQFLGIESIGKRVAYVIDLSDSMLIPLTQQERDDLKKPITRDQHEKKDPSVPEKKDPKDAKLPSERDLPWAKINNRFEAAREFLKLSLRTLDKDMAFVIVAFGNDAEVLTGRGTVPATKQNIEAAIKVLDDMKPGLPDTNRPYGTLRGFTNLHGGMLLAFRAVTGNTVRGEEHVNKDAFEQGVDTIFLLSDGAPSWENFACLDKRDPEDFAGDPETGAPLDTTAELFFHGTYEGDHLPQDIERMNLLRKCEIHCIGIGEANFTLLETIAKIGRGKVRKVGREK